MQSHHSAMSEMKPSKKAKEWFRRPPYSIKRSGASGQENTGRVHIHERGNKGSKETDFEG